MIVWIGEVAEHTVHCVVDLSMPWLRVKSCTDGLWGRTLACMWVDRDRRGTPRQWGNADLLNQNGVQVIHISWCSPENSSCQLSSKNYGQNSSACAQAPAHPTYNYADPLRQEVHHTNKVRNQLGVSLAVDGRQEIAWGHTGDKDRLLEVAFQNNPQHT